MRVLILGGTGEARALAARLHGRPHVEIVSSLAGRVSNPAMPVGAVRIGGFGGVGGLAAYVVDEHVDAVIDATHPFAATISAHAAEAAARTGRPLLMLRRPGWVEQPADDWRWAPDITAAAAATATARDGTVFLTTGRRDLAAFAGDGRHHYLVRTVEPPDPPLPPRTTTLLDRGPYTVEGERALMRRHGVVVLVTKDSGGAMTAAKLAAARELRVPVVVVRRPPPPSGVRLVEDVDAAVAWVAQRVAG